MDTSRAVSWSLETWPVQALAQAIRHQLDQDKVEELAESVRQGHELPAIFALLDQGRVTILDGHHRVAALHALGSPTVKVLVARPR